MTGRELIKHYLTPSKASSLVSGDFAFLRAYALKDRRESSAQMEKGTNIHELVYHMIRTKADPDSIAFNPPFPSRDDQLLKLIEETELKGEKVVKSKLREQTVSQAQQKKDWEDECKRLGKFVVSNDIKEEYQSLLIHFRNNQVFKDLTKDKDIQFETTFIDDQRKMGGTADIISDGILYDVKTTSKSIKKEEFAKNFGRSYATQQVVYEDLCLANKVKISEFRFIVIQTVWPFEVKVIKLPYHYVEQTRQWVYGCIYPKYSYFLSKIEEFKKALDFENKEGFALDPTKKFKSWSQLISIGVYDPSKIETAEVPVWEQRGLTKELESMRLNEARR